MSMSIGAHPPRTHALCQDPWYGRLKEHLIATTGLAYYADKDDDLASRLAVRIAQHRLSGCAAYLALLAEGPQAEPERDALIETLTIGETFFFRHGELFDALRRIVIPDLVARNQATRRLRIWSAGCSVGAEAYSLSIVLRRDFAAALAGWDVTILGTDINRTFLARAREGCYEDWALRNTPEEIRRAHFVRQGSAWSIAPEYREGVSFQYHNLVAHSFPSLVNNLFAFDLILCRNVTIYFAADIVRKVVSQLHESLADGGWLAVGHAEPNTELFRAFRTVNTDGAVLYQKSGVAAGGVATPAVPEAAPQAAGGTWTPPVLPDVPAISDITRRLTPLGSPAGVADIAAIRALADRGDWQAADRLCHAAQLRDRLNPAVYFYHALVLEQTGRHTDAERALRQAIYVDRSFVLAHYYLALLLQKQRHFPAAARSFENVLQLLATIAPEAVFAEGDGITADELSKLTRMHLESLEER